MQQTKDYLQLLISELLKALKEGVLGHTALEYKGRYYDAECSEGCGSFTDLPVVRRALSEANISLDSVDLSKSDLSRLAVEAYIEKHDLADDQESGPSKSPGM